MHDMVMLGGAGIFHPPSALMYILRVGIEEILGFSLIQRSDDSGLHRSYIHYRLLSLYSYVWNLPGLYICGPTPSIHIDKKVTKDSLINSYHLAEKLSMKINLPTPTSVENALPMTS